MGDFIQYQKSLLSSNNCTSNQILSEVWKTHVKHFDNKIHSLEIVNKTDNASSWKSSLSECNVDELLEVAIPSCPACSERSSYPDMDKIYNNKCKCDFGAKTVLTNTFTKVTRKPKTNFNTIDITNEDSSDDQKSLLQPKYSRSKFNKTNTTSVKPFSSDNYNCKSYYRVPKEKEYDIEIVDEEKAHASNVSKIIFKTAKDQLLATNPAARKILKASRKAQGKFVSPMIAQERQESSEAMEVDDRLKHLDPKMVELIESEIIDKGSPIAWEDIAGLEMAKSVIQEAVVWPLLRPDIFTGLRRPPKGILLFGPPGTGKTLIGKCVAAQCKATFFSISASSLTSKWIGDGEKMVRALFAVARCHQPAVIFIDEIDSLLSQRNDSEHEATRRIKTEFLVQFDGAATAEEDRFLIIGATNRPQELDEAARRRLVKRLYIPLPDLKAREQIITNLLENESHELVDNDVEEVSRLTAGYSGADMKSLCSEAAMGPIRSVPFSQMATISKDNMRAVSLNDFKNALDRVKPSVSQDDLGQYVKWNKTYGQGF